MQRVAIGRILGDKPAAEDGYLPTQHELYIVNEINTEDIGQSLGRLGTAQRYTLPQIHNQPLPPLWSSTEPRASATMWLPER